MREHHLGYAFFLSSFLQELSACCCEVWSCNSAWTMDSRQYVLKSCTIAKRVYYPGTRTLFFCTTGPVPETFSFIVTCFLNFVQPLKENLLMAQFASNPFQVVYLFSNKKNFTQFYPTVALNLSHLINLRSNNFENQMWRWFLLDIIQMSLFLTSQDFVQFLNYTVFRTFKRKIKKNFC